MPLVPLDEARPFRHPRAEQFISEMQAGGFEPLFDGARRRFGYEGPFVRVPKEKKADVERVTPLRLTYSEVSAGQIELYPLLP
jgi:hypothetical protein